MAGGTPRLLLDVNGNARFALLSGGAGTDDLAFSYTLQAGDAGATSVTVQSLDLNGATISGNGGKEAVATIADTVLNLGGSITDVTAPSGYAVAFTTGPVTVSNQSAASFQITGAEIGATYNYSISSSGGGTPLTGSGAIATATQNFTGIDVSSLPDGTLTVSLTLTDTAANIGAPATDTVIKDIITLGLNFVTGAYQMNGTTYGSPAAIPGWTFTRASPATTYAEDNAGNLVAFAANTPRITDKGLLIEGSRTNLHHNSEQINLWSNNAGAILVTPNSITAPNGTLAADVLTQTAATGAARWIASRVFTPTTGQAYTFSVWLRKVSGANPTPTIYFWNYGFIQQSVGPITSTWQRYTFTFTAGTSTNSPNYCGFYIDWDGNGAANDAAIGIWGAQLEQGSFASSYIPTAGATVTRGADDARMTGMSILPAYTAFAEFEYRATGKNGAERLLGFNATGGRSSVAPLTSTTLGHTAYNTLDGNTPGATGINRPVRRVAGVSTTSPQSRRIVADGGAVVGDAGTTPMTSTFYLGNESVNNNVINTYLRNITIYPSAKSDAALQALTQ